jgi:O-antigen/teichoic acid export membrane protein
LAIDRQLRIDFTHVFSGNVVYSACQWGIVLILARLGSPEQVGEYALGMAVCAPIVLFANLQVRTLLASDVKEEFTFGRYLSFRLATLAAALVAIAAAAMWSAPDPRRAWIVFLVGFGQLLEYLSDTYYGLMQKHQRMDRLSRSLIMKGPLSLAALIGAMYATHNVAWAVIGLAMGRLIILLTWDARIGYTKGSAETVDARLEWNTPDMLRLFKTALPLGIISMLAALSANVPRYFIEAYRGASELGIYAALASLLSAGNMAVSAFGQSIMVPAAKACAHGDRRSYRGFVLHAAVLTSILGGGAVLIAALFGRQLLTHLFRPQYAERADIFAGLMAAGMLMFVTSALGYIITAARVLKPQIPLLIANGVTAAAVSAWAIPRYGLRGAVYAVFAAYLVQSLGAAFLLWRIDRQLKSAVTAQDDLICAASPVS